MGNPWGVYLNDMRMSNVENRELVIVGPSLEAVEQFMLRERVEPYRDERWAKVFRKGGPLEWCNLPEPCFGQWPVELASEQQILDRYRNVLRSARVCLL